MTHYPITPESLKRQPTKTGPYVVSAIPSVEIAQQLNIIAKALEKTRPDEKVLVARVPYAGFMTTGDIWIEVESVIYSETFRCKMAWVKTLTGNELFQDVCMEGFSSSDECKYFATSLDHLAFVQNGEVIDYFGKAFSPTFLSGKMPEWCEDEGSTEYRLRQQELRNELDEECENFCKCDNEILDSDTDICGECR